MAMKKLNEELSLRKLSLGQKQFIDLDHENSFLKEVLDELNENVSKDDIGEDSFLKFSGELEKIEGKYEKFIEITGEISLKYYTVDVVTNKVISDELVQEVNCLVISDEVKRRFHFEDEIDIEHNGKEFDLYFCDENSFFNIKEILREYIYLNRNPYPKEEGQ